MAPTKITVNLCQRAQTALEAAVDATGDNRTDTINRAVQLYAYITKMTDDGHLVFVEHPVNGSRDRLVLL